MTNLSITDAVRGADALLTAWQCAHPTDRHAAQKAGYALLVCHYSDRLAEVMLQAAALQEVIDPAPVSPDT